MHTLILSDSQVTVNYAFQYLNSLLPVHVHAVSITTSCVPSSSVGVTGAEEGVGVGSAAAAGCVHPLLRHRRRIHILILVAYSSIKYLLKRNLQCCL